MIQTSNTAAERLMTLGIDISRFKPERYNEEELTLDDEFDGVVKIGQSKRFEVWWFDAIRVYLYENGSRLIILYCQINNDKEIRDTVNKLYEVLGEDRGLSTVFTKDEYAKFKTGDNNSSLLRSWDNYTDCELTLIATQNPRIIQFFIRTLN